MCYISFVICSLRDKLTSNQTLHTSDKNEIWMEICLLSQIPRVEVSNKKKTNN